MLCFQFFFSNSGSSEKLKFLLERQENLEKSLLEMIEKNFNVIDSKFELVSWIVEKREDSLPKIYRFKNKIDKTNFNYHFKKRDEYEKKYFKYNEKKINQKKVKITKIKKNIKKIKSILKKYKPKILITFGSCTTLYLH